MTASTKMAEAVFAALEGMLAKALAPLRSQIGDLRKKVEETPAVLKGDKGDRGEKGDSGEIGLPGERGSDGENGTPGERGEKGADGAHGPAGRDGTNGEPGRPGEAGDRGEPGARGDSGRDGKDGASACQIAQASGFKGSELEFLRSLQGKDGKDGEDGLDGRNGENGRDALQIEIVDLDETRGYTRGTFATYRGGLVRALRSTDPLEKNGLEKSGWQVILNGIAAEAESSPDGGRTIIRVTEYTNGKSAERKVVTPVMIYRGIWRDGAYETGDTVTRDGSLWHCNAPTSERPGDGSKDWQLAAKRGRDGKDGAVGKEGSQGKPGRDGRDFSARAE